ncbi:hypothetical protein M7I_1743 [Glarea lozoyensis 74030]|uniref:Uncharacterized protein n=1 Tax=Glarea lozoyensis (strain ATCC 74030 / MF5533) TaxID=1104152 RepID=H0EH09_GLAL7|nr:hypothetical protein M7I_1743 [Glarea lozoyensis 74030]
MSADDQAFLDVPRLECPERDSIIFTVDSRVCETQATSTASEVVRAAGYFTE